MLSGFHFCLLAVTFSFAAAAEHSRKSPLPRYHRFLAGCTQIWLDYCAVHPQTCRDHCGQNPGHDACCSQDAGADAAVGNPGAPTESPAVAVARSTGTGDSGATTTAAQASAKQDKKDSGFSTTTMVITIVVAGSAVVICTIVLACVWFLARRNAKVSASEKRSVQVDPPKLDPDNWRSPRTISKSTAASSGVDASNCMYDARSSDCGSSGNASPRPNWATPRSASPRSEISGPQQNGANSRYIPAAAPQRIAMQPSGNRLQPGTCLPSNNVGAA